MLSFEQYQEIGRQARKNYKESEDRIKKAEEERLRRLGISVKEPPKQQYEHPAMLDGWMMAVLFIAGYVFCLMFKGWWVGWIVLTAALGHYLGRHDND